MTHECTKDTCIHTYSPMTHECTNAIGIRMTLVCMQKRSEGRGRQKRSHCLVQRYLRKDCAYYEAKGCCRPSSVRHVRMRCRTVPPDALHQDLGGGLSNILQVKRSMINDAFSGSNKFEPFRYTNRCSAAQLFNRNIHRQHRTVIPVPP